MRPLLGRKACIGMKIVSYLDNDAINPPVTAARKETVRCKSRALTRVLVSPVGYRRGR